MEAQRIVVNGRNLPVFRWKELTEQAAANQLAAKTRNRVPNMKNEVTTAVKAQENEVPTTNQELSAGEQSTGSKKSSNNTSTKSADANIDSSKNHFVSSPPFRFKNMRRSKQYYKIQNAKQQLKTRYKTELCRHFLRSNYCPLEGNCQFAHGNHELRQPTDPLPEKFDDKSLGAIHSNYKTSACRNFTQTGQCFFGAACSFYHFESERRKLTDPLPSIPIEVQQQVANARFMLANMEFCVQNDYNQVYGTPQYDELCVAGGFDPNKYMAPLPQPGHTTMQLSATEWKPPAKDKEVTDQNAAEQQTVEPTATEEKVEE